MEAYRKLSVRIVCNEKGGSGVIININEEEKTILVITARHCIENIEDEYENLQIWDYQDTKLDIISKPCFPKDKSVDIAFIYLKLCKEYPSILLGEPKRNQNIFSYGYPSILSGYQNEGELINGNINEILIDKGLIKLSMTHQLATYDHDEYTCDC